MIHESFNYNELITALPHLGMPRRPRSTVNKKYASSRVWAAAEAKLCKRRLAGRLAWPPCN